MLDSCSRRWLVDHCKRAAIISSLLDCFYEYLRQPPTELDCNPYNGMRLECEVLAPVSVGVEVEIQWFYNDEQIMLDSFPVGTEITNEVDVIDENIRTSTLVFTSDFTDAYRGNYHCQIVVNGNFTAPSQSLSLVDEDIYLIFHDQFCLVAQAVDVSKCARRATIAPPSPSTTTQPDTSSPTTDPPTPPPTTSGSEMISTDHNINTVDTTMEVESPTSVESGIMVWLVVLVAVFGTVIIILIIGVLVYCLRKKLNNGTKGGF